MNQEIYWNKIFTLSIVDTIFHMTPKVNLAEKSTISILFSKILFNTFLLRKKNKKKRGLNTLKGLKPLNNDVNYFFALFSK